MVATLRSRRAARRSDALDGELARIGTALEAISTNVFVASLDLRLVFANQRALTTLRAIEHEVQAAFGISLDEILGGSIHRFHRDPAHVERILHGEAGVSFPHLAEFSFGSVTLRTHVNRLHDPSGAHLGYIVNWEDITDVVTAGRAVESLRLHLRSASGSIGELSSSIQMIAANSAEAAAVATSAAGIARQTTDVVASLGVQSGQIEHTIAGITEVADQTSLLALNATVEASRAGDAGRGFAVVAAEVKELANNTTAATSQIVRKTSEISTSVQQVVDSIGSISTVIDQVNEYQTSIASATEQQSAVTAEIADRIAQAVAESESLHL
ncbi:MAG: PAS domain-containing protein [Acidimicrobiales bacterium]|nr:PAS domain-containing protein [Acidimicrobiales bacterium]